MYGKERSVICALIYLYYSVWRALEVIAGSPPLDNLYFQIPGRDRKILYSLVF